MNIGLEKMKIDRSNYEAFFLDYLDGNLSEELRVELDVFLINNPDLSEELNDVRTTIADFDLMHKTGLEEKFAFKNDLKKSESFSVSLIIEELLVKELEGDLSQEEKSQLQTFEITNSNVAAVRSIISKTKLTSQAIFFDNKAELLWPNNIDLNGMPYALIAKVEGELNSAQEAQIQKILNTNPQLKSELSLYEKTKLRPQNIVFEDKASLRKKEAVIISMRNLYYSFSSAAAVIALIVWFNWQQPLESGQLARTDERMPMVKSPTQLPVDSDTASKDTTAPFIIPENRFIPNQQIQEIPQQDVAHNEQNVISVPTIYENKDPEIQNEISQPQNPVDQIQRINETDHDAVALVEAPDMTPVHNKNLVSKPGHESKPQTIFSLIGERVEKGVENSYAYGLVERKAEKIGASSKNAENKIIYERTTKDAETDQVKFKFMGIGFERDVAKKQEVKKSSGSRFSRLEKKYRSVISN